MARKPLTPRQKVDALLYRVHLQFGTYLKDAVSGEDLKPGDQIEFDHTNPVSETGDNHWTNVRPLQKKTNRDKGKSEARNCRHVKRIRGEMGAGKPKRKFASRPFGKSRGFPPKGARKMRGR